jgi:TatD DNase family protein
MLVSRNGRRILDARPRDRVLDETDGPYTTVSGRTAEPKDIPWLVAELADRSGMPHATTHSSVAENYRVHRP